MDPVLALRRFRRWLLGCRTRAERPRTTARSRRTRLEPLEDRRLLAATLYVNDDAAGLNTGANWADAYTDLQSALTAAASGDEIWVAAGTYKPTTTTDRTISFNLKEGVSLYGGFAGTETAGDQRDWTTNVTVLSGDIGQANDTYDNSNHVLRAVGVTAATVDGFTITAGLDSKFDPNESCGGAGMYNLNSSPTLRNVTFQDNRASSSASSLGGALYTFDGSPHLDNVVFVNNSASALRGPASGGAVYVAAGSLRLTGVSFVGNTAGVEMNGSAAGGGLYVAAGSATLVNVVFRENGLGGYGTTLSGAGMYANSATLTNVTFSGNYDAVPRVGHRNDALWSGSGVQVTNSIFWGDSSNAGSQISGPATITYSVVQGGWTGEGNLDADPLFVDAENGDLHLKPNSPAVDSGSNTGAPGVDRDGNLRPLDGSGDGVAAFDMGAYEAPTLINQPPVADAGGPYTVYAGTSVALSGAASYDPDAAITAYEWDMDYDGTTFDVDATGAWADFSAASGGAGSQYTVALRVVDTSKAVSPVATTTVSVAARQALPGGFELVSKISDLALIGATGNGDSAEYYGDISDDGRYVVFESSATNLVPGDTNGWSDLFLYDYLTGIVSRVSTDALGNQANGSCSRPVLSANGRYLEFSSDATNLAAGGNARDAVFLKDLVTGAIRCVSTDSSENPADEYCFPSIPTDDGRYALFWSYAGNLDASGRNGQCQLFLKDTASGVTTCVSTSSTGALADDYTGSGNVSADGRYVSFSSYGKNLVPDDTNTSRDLFIKDMASGATTRVSTDAAGNQADHGTWGHISDDGRYVLMVSSATNLVANDTNGVDDIFLKDLVTGVVTRLSTDGSGNEANAASVACKFTSNGRYVLFESTASNLVADDTNGVTDVFLKGLASGATTRVIADVLSGSRNGGLRLYASNASPEYVAFSTDAGGLAADDVNGLYDLFTRNLTDGAIALVSGRDPTVSSPIAAGLSTATRYSTSSDGRYVVFSSDSDKIVAGDTNTASDVFLQDMLTGTITRISTDRAGVQADDESFDPMISANGPYVLFTSSATNLVADDTNGIADVFIKDLNTGAVTRVSTDAATSAGVFAGFGACAISSNGRYVAYSSTSTRVYHYEDIHTHRLSVKDLETGEITILAGYVEQGYSNASANFRAAFSEDGRYQAYSYTSSAGSWTYIPDLTTGDTLTFAGLANVALNADAHNIVFSSNSSMDDGDTNGKADVFVSIFGQGVRRVSTDSQGLLADDDCYNPVISADGRYVVFISSATNLVAGDTNNQDDVFVKDLISGVLCCVSTDRQGVPTGLSYYSFEAGTFDPAISADGRYITFQSNSGTLAPGDGNSDPRYNYTAIDVFRALNPLCEQPPTDLALSRAAVADHAEAGTVVGTLSTSDPDAGDTFIYGLVAGAGDTDNWAFAIVGDQLTLLGAADRATQASYSIRVRTTDRLGRQSYEEVLTVTVVRDQVTAGLYDPETSTFYLRRENTTGMADCTFAFGEPGKGWQAIVGDWDGDGVSGVGLYDPWTSTFYLTDSCTTGYAQYMFGYGQPKAGWVPVAGDWDGDGRTGVGLYDPLTSTFFLTDALQTGAAQYTFGYGQPGAAWKPIVGDWNADRRADVGLYDPRSGTFYLTTERQAGIAQHMFSFGEPSRRWEPVAGDWNADGCAGVGLYDPRGSTFYLANALTDGFADCTLGFGQPRAGWTPLAGYWPALDAQTVDQLDLADLADSTLKDLETSLG